MGKKQEKKIKKTIKNKALKELEEKQQRDNSGSLIKKRGQ